LVTQKIVTVTQTRKERGIDKGYMLELDNNNLNINWTERKPLKLERFKLPHILKEFWGQALIKLKQLQRKIQIETRDTALQLKVFRPININKKGLLLCLLLWLSF
jgi:hypothetical protein